MEYIVYVQINENRYITAVNSSAFLSDVTDWIEIDRGYGDKYHHSQGNYFQKPIMTDEGAYQYKLIDGAPVECVAEEIAEQIANMSNYLQQTQEERIAALEEENAMLTECILEMSEIIYA